MTPRESVAHMEDDRYQVRMLVKQIMDISYILGLQSLSDVWSYSSTCLVECCWPICFNIFLSSYSKWKAKKEKKCCYAVTKEIGKPPLYHNCYIEWVKEKMDPDRILTHDIDPPAFWGPALTSWYRGRGSCHVGLTCKGRVVLKTDLICRLDLLCFLCSSRPQ